MRRSCFTVLLRRRLPARSSPASPRSRFGRRGRRLARRASTAASSARRSSARRSPSREYFQPRPRPPATATTAPPSAGSNLGPTTAELLAAVEERAVAYRERERPARRRRRSPSTPSPPRARASTRTSRWPTPGSRRRGSPRPGGLDLDDGPRRRSTTHTDRPTARLPRRRRASNVLAVNLALDDADGP